MKKNRLFQLPVVFASTLAAISTLSFHVSETHAQSLVYEYGFNDAPGTTSGSTGSSTTAATLHNTSGVATDLHGTSGSGVSGAPGDYSFDNTASTRMGGVDSVASGGSARVADSNALDLMTSFTLQGWYKIDPSITGDYSNGRIITKNAGTYTNQFVVTNSRNGNNGRLELALGTPTFTAQGNNINSGYNSLLGENGWVFFAVTYDSTLAIDNVKFYAGTTDDTVVHISSHNYLAGITGDNTATLFFGASSLSNNRPFDGWLDNIRIYRNEAGIGNESTGALSLAQLESLRALDVNPIPEPSAIALIAFAALSFVQGRRKSHQL